MRGTGNNMSSPITQHEKAIRFNALHAGPGAFVIPNPWDAGSARLLAALGFEALATSGYAFRGLTPLAWYRRWVRGRGLLQPDFRSGEKP